MLAIAALCKMKGWQFEYYTKPSVQRVKEQGYGNLHQSLVLGMKHIELEQTLYRGFIASLRVNLEPMTLVLDQGGADALAQEGIALLAKEIESMNLDTKSVVLPSGTGTTALYLALALPLEYTVYTVASIGDSAYLKVQMQALVSRLPRNLIILEPSRKYHFAKPYEEFYGVYCKLLDAGIEFDLLYAPLTWKTLLENGLENILYIHTGGVSGNKSMLERYKAKGILS